MMLSGWMNEAGSILSSLIPLFKPAILQTLTFVFVVWGALYVKRIFTAKMNMLPMPSPFFAIATFLKNIAKSPIVPEKADKMLFKSTPVVAICSFLFLFLLMPLGGFTAAAYVKFGSLYMLFIIYAGVYAFVLSGFSSGSRFAFLGAVRALIRLLSVQMVLCMIVATILLTTGATDLNSIVKAQKGLWFIFPHFPMAILFVACTLFLLNNFRFEAPFAQKELASGVYAGYSSGLYLFLFLSDYALTVFMALLGAFLFLGGTLVPFGWTFLPPSVWLGIKTALFFLIFVIAENTLPDFRSDQLLRLSFKWFLPITVFWLIVTAVVCIVLSEVR